MEGQRIAIAWTQCGRLKLFHTRYNQIIVENRDVCALAIFAAQEAEFRYDVWYEKTSLMCLIIKI